jgi:hypothetical protein
VPSAPHCLRCESSASSAEDAEFISLGISEHDPRLITGLPDVGMSCTEGQKPVDLGSLISSAEVEVKPILDHLLIRGQPEQQTWQLVGRRADLELVLSLIDYDPSQCRRPPPPQSHGIVCIDEDLFPDKRHYSNVVSLSTEITTRIVRSTLQPVGPLHGMSERCESQST